MQIDLHVDECVQAKLEEFLSQEEMQELEDFFKVTLTKIPEQHGEIQSERVELAFTDNVSIQVLNRQYRQKDAPTDVLSFPIDGPDGENLGQLVISLERAKEQAEELGQSLTEEVKFLFVHGLLHLLGYDHQNSEEEAIMLDKAYRLLGRKA